MTQWSQRGLQAMMPQLWSLDVAVYWLSEDGIKDSLQEKGWRWNAEDFPTNSFKMGSAAKYENRNIGLRFGQQNALFQVINYYLLARCFGIVN